MVDMDIYDRYARMFPGFAEITIEWKSTGVGEILVILEDNSEYIYDSSEDILIPLKRDGLTDEESWSNEFSRRLRKKMYLCGITQKEVAEYCGVTQATVSRYVSGTSMPNGYVIRQIAKLLDCDPNELICFDY